MLVALGLLVILLCPQFNAFWGPKPFHALGGPISFGGPMTPIDTMFS